MSGIDGIDDLVFRLFLFLFSFTAGSLTYFKDVT